MKIINPTIMENLLQWLEDQWFGLILTVISIFLAVYFYIKSRRQKKPVYLKKSFNFISDSIKEIGDIEVKFKGNQVNNLTLTKVAIWNNGNETINVSDQAPTDPLRISLPDEKHFILDSEIIYKSCPANNFIISNNDREVLINFDYLDKKQGCIIKILHTGKSSWDVDILGTFKGSGNITNFSRGFFNKIPYILFTLPMGVTFKGVKIKNIYVAIPFIIGGIVMFIYSFPSAIGWIEKLLSVGFSLFLFSFGVFLIFVRLNLPKGFEKCWFED